MSGIVIAAWVMLASPEFSITHNPKEAAYFVTREACEAAAKWMIAKRGRAESYRCFPTGAP
jgi:hypothetical protein